MFVYKQRCHQLSPAVISCQRRPQISLQGLSPHFSVFSVAACGHGLPPFLRAGFVHVRVLRLIPPSHHLLHIDQELQLLHPPSTTREKENMFGQFFHPLYSVFLYIKQTKASQSLSEEAYNTQPKKDSDLREQIYPIYI